MAWRATAFARVIRPKPEALRTGIATTCSRVLITLSLLWGNRLDAQRDAQFSPATADRVSDIAHSCREYDESSASRSVTIPGEGRVGGLTRSALHVAFPRWSPLISGRHPRPLSDSRRRGPPALQRHLGRAAPA